MSLNASVPVESSEGDIALPNVFRQRLRQGLGWVAVGIGVYLESSGKVLDGHDSIHYPALMDYAVQGLETAVLIASSVLIAHAGNRLKPAGHPDNS